MKSNTQKPKMCKAKTDNNESCRYKASMGDYCMMHWQKLKRREKRR